MKYLDTAIKKDVANWDYQTYQVMTYKTIGAKTLTGFSAISTIILSAKEQTLEVLLIGLLATGLGATASFIGNKCYDVYKQINNL